jgi:peptide-methionine (R)-S-oxide reductase
MMNWETVVLKSNNQRASDTLKVIKTEEEWRQLLSPEVFHITRKKGTERPFSNQMCSAFEPGIYECACCGLALFHADEKFESGTGWPSFTKPLDENAVFFYKDASFGHQRIEVCCQSCDAHLGHVFPDGPKPTRLRFCINALALKKIAVK